MTEIPSRRDGDSKATKSVCCHSISFFVFEDFLSKERGIRVLYTKLENFLLFGKMRPFCKFAYTMGFLKFGQKIRNLA